jgi:phosphoserine aminotransferase
MARIFNFSAGPAVLPEEVLREAAAEMLDFKGSGMSIMECSHRGKEYEPVHAEAAANLKSLMGIPDTHTVLFLQGGASMQFAQVPMNLLTTGTTADYVVAGSWGDKAVKEAKLIGNVNIAASTKGKLPAAMPSPSTWKLTPGAAYVHVTSNETIEGCQMQDFPSTEAPLVADMSSDILCRPVDVSKFGLIYAGAQKNLGPSGVVLVIVRKDLMERAPASLPVIFKYKTHFENESMYNTPPTFSIYMLNLVTRWLIKQGGAVGIHARNTTKAGKIYSEIDGGSFYKGTAATADRSIMNVTFRLPTEALEEEFVKQASKLGMKGLKGHRSVGGIRASIYNAFPEAGVDALVAFMREFAAKNG